MKATITAQSKKQHVGVYAGDPSCYKTFPITFGEIIKGYHNIAPTKNEQTRETYEKVTLPKLPSGDAVVSTRIRTARNLTGYPFTCNMTKGQRVEVEKMMKKV